MADVGTFHVELAAAVMPELDFSSDIDDAEMVAASIGATSKDIATLINRGSALTDLPPPETPAHHEAPPPPAQKINRFKHCTAEEVEYLFDARQSSNTKRNTVWGVRIFQGKHCSKVDSVVLRNTLQTLHVIHAICNTIKTVDC
jgi:hypothetical protein